MTHNTENDAPDIARVDRYTINVHGYRVRADAEQERRIRAMSIEERARFLVVVGHVIPPEQTQPPPGHEEPWEWHPDGPEAHALLEKIHDEEDTP